MLADLLLHPSGDVPAHLSGVEPGRRRPLRPAHCRGGRHYPDVRRQGGPARGPGRGDWRGRGSSSPRLHVPPHGRPRTRPSRPCSARCATTSRTSLTIVLGYIGLARDSLLDQATSTGLDRAVAAAGEIGRLDRVHSRARGTGRSAPRGQGFCGPGPRCGRRGRPEGDRSPARGSAADDHGRSGGLQRARAPLRAPLPGTRRPPLPGRTRSGSQPAARTRSPSCTRTTPSLPIALSTPTESSRASSTAISPCSGRCCRSTVSGWRSGQNPSGWSCGFRALAVGGRKKSGLQAFSGPGLKTFW